MRHASIAAVAAALFTLACTTAASAQTVDAGMNREQVMSRLGPVVAERNVGPRTYMFYKNGCEVDCGTHDVVILEHGVVVDAIFRAPYRKYSGKSSSPVALPAQGDSVAPVAPQSRGGFVAGVGVAPVPTDTTPGISAMKDSTVAKTDSAAQAKRPKAPWSHGDLSDTTKKRPPSGAPNGAP